MSAPLTAHPHDTHDRLWRRTRIAAWAAPALFMLVMGLHTATSAEEGWSAGDFVFASVLFYGALGAFEVALRRAGSPTDRAAFGLWLASMVLLLWGNAALGVTDTDADGWYLGVLAVGIVGPLVARFRAPAMSYAMFATALTMALVSGIALAGGKVGPNNSPLQITAIAVFYAALFVGSGLLFRRASRGDARTSAA